RRAARASPRPPQRSGTNRTSRGRGPYSQRDLMIGAAHRGAILAGPPRYQSATGRKPPSGQTGIACGRRADEGSVPEKRGEHMHGRRSRFTLALLGAVGIATLVVSAGVADPTVSFTTVPANHKVLGIDPPNVLSPQLQEIEWARGSNPVENPQKCANVGLGVRAY